MAKNNAKKELSDAQYRYDQLVEEKTAAVAASEQLQQTILELEATCQSHLEDKRELKVPPATCRWQERWPGSRGFRELELETGEHVAGL